MEIIKAKYQFKIQNQNIKNISKPYIKIKIQIQNIKIENLANHNTDSKSKHVFYYTKKLFWYGGWSSSRRLIPISAADAALMDILVFIFC